MLHRTVSTQIERQLAINGSNHALVIGGMVDRFAARVLTDYFDSVTIVERDRFPKHQDRAGCASVVPRTCAAGARTADSGTAFPGLEAELTAAGASTVDWTALCHARF